MNIVLNRVDERLIHGQILTSWINKCSAEQILILDDALAKDTFMQSVFSLAVPNRVLPVYLTLQDGVARLLDGMQDKRRSIVLFQNLNSAYTAYKAGYRMRSLNVGSIAAGPMRRKLSRDVYATETEIAAMKQLMADGVDIYVQVVGAENRINMATLLNG